MMTLTLGTSSESGLKRVPREGPPTWKIYELDRFFSPVRSLRE